MPRATCPECGNSLLPGAEGACPKCLLLLGFASPSEGSPASTPNVPSIQFSEAPGDRIGHYKLLEVIGEGAFGVVWMAEQETPVRRRVALKIIKLGMDTRAVVARFEAERQALALMDHPNIARVFDGGATEKGRPFFVMELVRGVPLTEFCDAKRLNSRERLELFITVCEAVQHAHQKGIIHRDLKPSNILVTEQDGRAVAKVIDFGIVKATEQRLTDKTIFTHFDQFMGTPAYMSPEQTGLGLDIDTRSDVYSLGVVLYELIAGDTPFGTHKLLQAGLESAQRTIRETEPPKPSTRLSSLPRQDLVSIAARRREAAAALPRLIRGELDWIILKALEKDRARRYPTANALANDLQRFLKNQPVNAAPPTFAYQFAKLARRNRSILIPALAFLVVLMGGIVASTMQAVRASRSNAEAQRNLAQASLNAYASEMNVAQQALTENNLERTLQLLEAQRPKPGESDLRGFEWRYLWKLCRPNHRAIFHDAAFGYYANCAIEFSPDGRWLAYAGTNGVVIRNVQTRRHVAHLPTEAHTLTFSPDSRVLAAGNLWRSPVRFWDTITWNEIQTPLPDSRAPAFFSPDGRWFVSALANTNLLQLCDTTNWQAAASCPHTPLLSVSLRSAVTFSPDGKFLVSPWMQVLRKGGGSGLFVWTVPSLEKVAELFVPDIPIQGARFLPDGKHLATPSWLGHLLVWDMSADPPQIVQQEREHTTYIPSIALSADGRTFVTGSADQSICLWDVSTRKRMARWRGHRREVWGVTMTPDGGTLASCSPDGTVRLWSGRPATSGEVVEDAGDVAGFTADGRTLVLAPGKDDYRWQLITGTNRISVPIPEDPPLDFDFIRPYAVTGAQPLAAIGRTKGKVELWDLRAGSLVNSWNPGTRRITAMAFSPDGLNLAAGDDEGIVRLWEIASSKELWEAKVLKHTVTALVFSHDGRMLATGNQIERKTRVWDMRTFQQIALIRADANKVAFALDGKSLVTCTVNGNEARIWQLPSGKDIGTLKGHVGGMTEVTFCPDGKTMATGAYDGRIKLWNTVIGQEVGVLPYPGMITALQFSPDGRTLAASVWVSPGYRAVLFRAPLLDEIEEEERPSLRSRPQVESPRH